MPLYQYRCIDSNCEMIVSAAEAGNLVGLSYHSEWEEYRATFEGRDKSICPVCGGDAVRAHDKELPNIRPDIEPGYNVSVGAHIGSRRELREHMAFHNAASDDLITNSYPSDGRLVKEERDEVRGKSSVLDNRKKAGWGREPSTSGFDIKTEGVADYQKIRDYAKEHKRKGAR